MRAAIIAKSVVKVMELLITAVSEIALWSGLETIAVKSVVNVVRLAIVAKSTAKA